MRPRSVPFCSAVVACMVFDHRSALQRHIRARKWTISCLLLPTSTVATTPPSSHEVDRATVSLAVGWGSLGHCKLPR